jgi:hypothetical protein
VIIRIRGKAREPARQERLLAYDVQLYTIDGKAVKLHRTCVPSTSLDTGPAWFSEPSFRGAS